MQMYEREYVITDGDTDCDFELNKWFYLGIFVWIEFNFNFN